MFNLNTEVTFWNDNNKWLVHALSIIVQIMFKHSTRSGCWFRLDNFYKILSRFLMLGACCLNLIHGSCSYTQKLLFKRWGCQDRALKIVLIVNTFWLFENTKFGCWCGSIERSFVKSENLNGNNGKYLWVIFN